MSLVCKPAPNFHGQAVLPNKQFGEVKLNDYKGKWLVLFFYPLDFTFVCPTEITALSDVHGEFAKRGADIVGVSIDSHFTHLAWIEKGRTEGGLGQLNFPLLSDLTKQVSQDYGVLLPAGMSLRATYIIDPNGEVKLELVHDLGVGRNVDEILRFLDALQFSAKHGEVCPAGWRPGKDAMKPTSEGLATYAKKHGGHE